MSQLLQSHLSHQWNKMHKVKRKNTNSNIETLIRKIALLAESYSIHLSIWFGTFSTKHPFYFHLGIRFIWNIYQITSASICSYVYFWFSIFYDFIAGFLFVVLNIFHQPPTINIFLLQIISTVKLIIYHLISNVYHALSHKHSVHRTHSCLNWMLNNGTVKISFHHLIATNRNEIKNTVL